MTIRFAASRFSTVVIAGLLLLGFGLAGCGHPKPAETDVLNVAAKLPAGLPALVLDWRVVTSSVDRTHSTISTLTANDRAIPYAGVGKYPSGSVLALTTWHQRDDPHWFGARIPGAFASLEMVTFAKGPDGQPSATYQRYEGDPAHEVIEVDAAARKTAILAMRNAEMP